MIKNFDKRKATKTKIVQFILQSHKASKTEIAFALNLSMPTVLQNVKELMDEKIVIETGVYQSTGGRKAKALSISPGFRYAVGIDITKNHLSFIIIDLKGHISYKNRMRTEFQNNPDYYDMVKQKLESIIEKTEMEKEKILGIGISFPGIIDKESATLVKSHVLGIDYVSLRNISQIFDYPVYFENDANAAAIAEMNYVNGNAVYLSLSNSVGGAVYMNHAIYQGDYFKSAEFGHMIIKAGGRTCYCGKRGCADSYCSAKVLTSCTGGDLGVFFQKLKEKDGNALKIWDEYLEYLAILVTNLRMAYDCDVILGGYVGSYMNDYLMELTRKTIKYNGFEDDTTYIKACARKEEAAAFGSAMYFVNNFIKTL